MRDVRVTPLCRESLPSNWSGQRDYQGLRCQASTYSDPPKQKTRPLFSFEPMALNTVKTRNFTVRLTSIVQIGRVLEILD